MFTPSSARLTMVLALAVLTACAKDDSAATDSATAVASSTDATPAAPTLSLADVAGKWNVVSTPTSGTDMKPNNYVLTATNNTSGWSILFPGRTKAVPVEVSVDGDSLITKAGPFESVRRKGVQVITNAVWRLQGDRLTGSTTAHYQVKGADSVLVLTNEGTRAK